MRLRAILRPSGKSLLARLRSDGGFGLVELLVAMLVTMIAVMALVAALSSSHVALLRASRISTAAAVASAELETYRALKYSEFPSPTPWTSPSGTTRQGADGRLYPVTITVVDTCPNGSAPTGSPLACSSSGRPLKSVTVVVREPTTTNVLVRESSAFEELTGS